MTLALRNASLAEGESAFGAVTSLSLIDERASICQRLKQEHPNMSELEIHHFLPKSYEKYSDLFIKPLPTCVFSTSPERTQLCSRYQMVTMGSPAEILAQDDAMKMNILDVAQADMSQEVVAQINETVA